MDNNKQTKALKEVIEKFDHIGNCYYNGKHHDNVLNIFNDLDENDRKEFLRGTFAVYKIIESGHEKTTTTAVVPKLEPFSKGENLSIINEQSLVELKIWFIKMLGIVVTVGIIILIGLVMYFSNTAETGANGLGKVFKILSLLMN